MLCGRKKFHSLLQSILVHDGTVAIEVGDLTLTCPTGTDRDILLDVLRGYARGKVTDIELRDALDQWTTERECAILEKWLPGKKDLKNEENQKAHEKKLRMTRSMLLTRLIKMSSLLNIKSF